MNDFDLRSFVDNLRATKPPYECPFEECGKVYKSFSGIQEHLVKFKHVEKSEPKFGLSSNRALTRDSLSWLQAQKIVDFELDGKPMRINIYEPLEIISVWDKDLVPEKRSPKEISYKHKDIRPPNSPRSKAPEATFRIIEEFISKDAPPLPASYLKYIEKPADELEDEIEYDMDEEDYAWLSLINERRLKVGLPKVSENTLEMLMDCFEKESHFRAAASSESSGCRQLFDEDAVCCVCNDGECDNSNAILFCDMCNLAVHQECYGVPYIPEGQWLCRRCQLSPSQAVDCVLCPNRGGAFKQTSDGRWAHVVCALWVPEVQFANIVFLEPIESFERVPAARWKLSCYVCKQKAGACIQCHKPSCYTAFHVTCAQSAGLYTKIEPVKDLSPGETTVTVRKTAFCDAHAPAAKDANADENDRKTPSHEREDSKTKIRKARKLLAQRRNSSPPVSIPVISGAKLDSLASHLKLAGKQEFLQRLYAYWTLKRKSRFGVPLLRRLQVCHQTKRTKEAKSQPRQVGTQVRYWRRLRQDLEKARLLVELIRKREQRKREIVTLAANFVELLFSPRNQFLARVVAKLSEKDERGVFAKPVTEDEVPGYHRFVKNPMDLGTMKLKASSGQYFDPMDLQIDFNLMISNCMMFNKKNPYFLKYAQKMKRLSMQILKDAATDYDKLKSDLTETNYSQLLLPLKETNVLDLQKTKAKKKEAKEKGVAKRGKRKSNIYDLFDEKKETKKAKLSGNVKPKSPGTPKPSKSLVAEQGEEDSRPLSSLVLDESRNLSAFDDASGAKKTSQRKPDKKSKNKSVSKRINRSEVQEQPRSPYKVNVNSPRSPRRPEPSVSAKPSGSATNRSSFRTFRAAEATSPYLKSEDDSNSSTDKDETEESLGLPSSSTGRMVNAAQAPKSEGDNLQLEHLDIVWASTPDHSFPFPGVIVDPGASLTYDSQAGHPKPPEHLRKQTFGEFRYLVSLFNENSSWHWLEAKRVEPLFVDSSLDRRKLAIPKKVSEKKILQKAYDAAVKFRCKNTGEDAQEFSVEAGDVSDASSSCE